MASSINRRAALLAVVVTVCASVFILHAAMVLRGYQRGDIATKVSQIKYDVQYIFFKLLVFLSILACLDFLSGKLF